jgi:hypothetical protein
MLDVEAFKPEIAELCRRVKVTRLDLIEPSASHSLAQQGEIDVLARFQRDGEELFNRFFDLKEGLEEVLGRTVDVLVDGTLRNPDPEKVLVPSRKTIYRD